MPTGSGGVGSFVKGIRDFKSLYPNANISRVVKSGKNYENKKVSFSSGFIPNFAKMQDLYKNTKIYL